MTGLRERKKLATATALSDAALELAAEVGVAGVTVEAIAARAGVSVRTFFNYFSAKEEAMVASHRQEMALLVHQIEDRPRDEPIMRSLRLTAHTFFRTEPSRLHRTRDLLRQVGDAPELLSHRLHALAEIEHQLADGATVSDVLRLSGMPQRGVAVALDGEVVPRAEHPRTVLGDGATIEVLTAVQGG